MRVLKTLLVKVASVAFGGSSCLLHLLLVGVLLLRLHSKLLSLDFFLGHTYLAAEANVVAMGKEDVLVLVAVPVLLEYGWYLACGKVVVKTLRVLDVFVVGYAAILRNLLVNCGVDEMGLIAIAYVGAVHQKLEVRRALVGIITSAI